MDGNGRWANRRKQKRAYGHYHGAINLFKIAKFAQTQGIKILTVFAFSTENWKRPKDEIDYLTKKPIEYYHKHKDLIDELTYRIKFIGDLTKFSSNLQAVMNEIEEKTKHNQTMLLNICANYGGQSELIKASSKGNIADNLLIKEPVDLLIRTGGEMRISNFLLWQSAYAELYFTKTYWPGFRPRNLLKAIKTYYKRHRRFGGLT